MSIGAVTSETSHAIYLRQRIALNFFLIWVDPRIDELTDDCQTILTQLRSLISNVKTFTEQDEAVDFLTEIDGTKALLVIEGTIGRHIVSLIHDTPQLYAIYIFCGNQSQNEQWIKDWVKIQGVYTDFKLLYEALQAVAKQCNQDPIAMSFITVDKEALDRKSNQLDPCFMYTQLFKEILLSMKYDRQSITNFTTYCRTGDYGTLSNIDRFENEYSTESAIWWYTFSPFVYPMLNRALRILEIETIIKMGFFIHDLHQQIDQLYRKQINSYGGKPFTVYRGQGLSKPDFEKLRKLKDGLISFNNFLSTSTDRNISLGFAMSALERADTLGIIFRIFVDLRVSSTPLASIGDVSYFQTEEEVLFSMHTIFRIDKIDRIDDNSLLYEVYLRLTADDDEQLRTLSDRIRKEIEGETSWERMGKLLNKLSQFDTAEEIFNILVEQTSDEDEKAIFYNNIGDIKNSQGSYEKAMAYYKKVLEIQQKTLPSNYPLFATTYNNIGVVYRNMGEYSKALSCYEKSVELLEAILPKTNPILATFYNNIAAVSYDMGNYSKVLPLYEKALEIQRKTLPSNHPDLTTTYYGFGTIYMEMTEYSKARWFYEQALEIQQRVLPSNHYLLSRSYNKIGTVHMHLGEYSKALSLYEKAFEIMQTSLSPDHPEFGHLYNNIGTVYEKLGEYSKALLFYEKDLESCQKTLASNHPHLAICYNNIGGAHMHLREYSKALLLYEKALEIDKKNLATNHPGLATYYHNIAAVYKYAGDYLKALSFHEKALEIERISLPSNHPDLAISYNSMGLVYYDMREYSKALSLCEKALEIRQRSLPQDHPDLVNSYNSIGAVYEKMGEYSKALLFHEKDLEISQKTLPPNHPHLAICYNNIGVGYMHTKEYLKALSFHEKALQIQQEALASDHPDFALSFNGIGAVYCYIGEYTRALLHFERARSVLQRSLPSDHPNLEAVRRNIEYLEKRVKVTQAATINFDPL